MRTLLVEAHARAGAIDDQRHLVAIPARIAHPDRFGDGDFREPADARERVANDLPFPSELRGIGEVLQLTAAALAKDRTERRDPGGGRLENRQQFGNGVLRLNCGDAHARTFLGERAGTKNDDAAGTPDRLAVGKHIGKREFEFGAGANADRQAF